MRGETYSQKVDVYSFGELHALAARAIRLFRCHVPTAVHRGADSRSAPPPAAILMWELQTGQAPWTQDPSKVGAAASHLVDRCVYASSSFTGVCTKLCWACANGIPGIPRTAYMVSFESKRCGRQSPAGLFDNVVNLASRQNVRCDMTFALGVRELNCPCCHVTQASHTRGHPARRASPHHRGVGAGPCAAAKHRRAARLDRGVRPVLVARRRCQRRCAQ